MALTRRRLLYAGRGIIDPCPLWDEDGQAYLVHGWAHSRIGVKNRLELYIFAANLKVDTPAESDTDMRRHLN